MGGKQLIDRQKALNHSWWITDVGAWSIRPQDWRLLKPLLIKPPKTFVLSLIDKPPNQLQTAIINDHCEVKADTPLGFTLDNTPYWYTTYELAEALKTGELSGEPGVRLLAERIRAVEPIVPQAPPEPKRMGGKADIGGSGTILGKTIARSGAQV
jgi:hypothetical protein